MQGDAVRTEEQRMSNLDSHAVEKLYTGSGGGLHRIYFPSEMKIKDAIQVILDDSVLPMRCPSNRFGEKN